MGWYQYTGSVVRGIATGYGEVVAVEPYGRVELHRLTAVTEKMVKNRVLRPCGPPARPSTYAVRAEGGGAHLQPSEFAGYFADRGATRDAKQAPIKQGVVERTALEIAAEAAVKNVSVPEAGGSVEESAPPVAADLAGVDAVEADDTEARATQRRRVRQ